MKHSVSIIRFRAYVWDSHGSAKTIKNKLVSYGLYKGSIIWGVDCRPAAMCRMVRAGLRRPSGRFCAYYHVLSLRFPTLVLVRYTPKP